MEVPAPLWAGPGLVGHTRLLLMNPPLTATHTPAAAPTQWCGGAQTMAPSAGLLSPVSAGTGPRLKRSTRLSSLVSRLSSLGGASLGWCLSIYGDAIKAARFLLLFTFISPFQLIQDRLQDLIQEKGPNDTCCVNFSSFLVYVHEPGGDPPSMS